MIVEFKPEAQEDFLSLDRKMQKFFDKHIQKLVKMPARKKRMKYGLPFHKENVTKQARLVYDVSGDKLFVIRCFSTHKEYERWYLGFKRD